MKRALVRSGLFFLFLVFSVLYMSSVQSCKKGRANFIITGTIRDGSFSSGLSNCTIQLYKTVAGESTSTLVETVTSADGSYRFEVERDQSESYMLKVTKNNYFPIEQFINFSSLSIKEDNVFNLTTYAKSWVRLHFVNIDPQPNDMLKYQRVKGKIDCDECCPSSFVQFTAADTSIYCINDGNTPYSYNYWVLGTSISDSESVVTVPFDTTDLYLEW